MLELADRRSFSASTLTVKLSRFQTTGLSARLNNLHFQWRWESAKTTVTLKTALDDVISKHKAGAHGNIEPSAA